MVHSFFFAKFFRVPSFPFDNKRAGLDKIEDARQLVERQWPCFLPAGGAFPLYNRSLTEGMREGGANATALGHWKKLKFIEPNSAEHILNVK